MDNVISIIERLGADSGSKANVVEVLKHQQIESGEIAEAILNTDIEKLEMLLNVRNKIVCMVFPVEEPKERPNEPEEDDKPEEVKTTIAV